MAFPATVPVLSALNGFSVKKKPIFAATVVQAVTGREITSAQQAFPVWDFDLTYEVLRSETQNQDLYTQYQNQLELEQIITVFLACSGQYSRFYYNDPTDNSRTGQVIATGDGVSSTFQIVRTFGTGSASLTEPVGGLNSLESYQFYVNGTPTSVVLANYNRTITISPVPGVGDLITGDFYFYYLCRFLSDANDFEQFLTNLWRLGSLKFRSVKYDDDLATAAVMGLPAAPTPPGIVWNEYDIAPINNVWEDIEYANGIFVAVGSDPTLPSKIITSSDGVAWTAQTVPTTTRMISVAYGDGKFVAVGGRSSFTNKVITSADNGITWVNQVSPYDGNIDNTFEGVAYGNGLFVAVGHGFGVATPLIMTSPDGITWTARTGPTAKKWEDVIYAAGLFVAIASDGTGSTSRVMTSPDGITWTLRTTTAVAWRSIAYGNGIFVVVASQGSNVMTSPDGITWTLRPVPLMEWFAVAYGGGMFVAVNTDSSLNAVMTSPDGINWTLRSIPSLLLDWFCVEFGSNVFVSLSGDKLIASGSYL